MKEKQTKKLTRIVATPRWRERRTAVYLVASVSAVVVVVADVTLGNAQAVVTSEQAVIAVLC